MRGIATEADILKTILDGLLALGIFAFRINTGTGWVKGRPIKSHTLGKGAADILAFPKVRQNFVDMTKANRLGRPLSEALSSAEVSVVLWIETKRSMGRQSPEQKSFETNVRFFGQEYLVARSWDDVAAWLKERGL